MTLDIIMSQFLLSQDLYKTTSNRKKHIESVIYIVILSFLFKKGQQYTSKSYFEEIFVLLMR